MISENNSIISGDDTLPSMTSLLAFEAAAKQSSFAEAARQLGRTPSAVSHAIKDLENLLGTVLFARVGRSVQLTEVGTEYFQSVQDMLEGLRFAGQKLKRAADKHIIRISALPFFTSTVLLPHLDAFEAMHPEYDLRLETSNTYANVANGDVDVAIRFGGKDTQGLFVKRLMSIAGQPIAAPSYLEKAGSLEHLSDLQHHTIIHVRQDPNAWSNWFRSLGGLELNPKRELMFDSILGAIDAVKAGQGIALAMHPLICADPAYGSMLLPVLNRSHTHIADYNFVCRRQSREDRKIRYTLNWLETHLENMTSEIN